MAIIPLRAYSREIEGMIDNGQLEEAVAHCRHILATFPKHIASYRLLGKAHLEQQRISDATDIFQRVLSSVPDDFISNVGMSIIREDENNLDSAIWHMELAYEAQPANVAIQDELRRLYGRRDGLQPPKVRLTRGALARMYAKGGLYDQAVAELRAAIAEEPNRPDLQLLLAEMFFQTSQRVEAVETCANILKKIPFCLEANRILAVSLPEAEGSDAIRNYRQIVISMDPYYAFAAPDAISSDQVPENAVNIERLDWKSGIQIPEAQPQPNWATSLGISVDKPADENFPEWLKSAEAPAPAPPGDNVGSAVSPFIWDTQEVQKIITDTSKPEPEIPDWMKDAGWQPASGEAIPPPQEITPEGPFEETSISDDLEKAEIPDWLQGIAPEGILDEGKPAEESAESNLSTPWLEQHQPGPTDSIIHWLEDNKPENPRNRPAKEEVSAELSEDEVPDWLKDLEPTPAPSTPSLNAPSVTPAFTIEPSAFIAEPPPAEGPETKALPFDAPPEQIGIPAEETHAAQPESILPGMPASTEPVAEPAEEVPDWLRQLAGDLPPEGGGISAETIIPAETPPEPQPEPAPEMPPPAEEAPLAELQAAEKITPVEIPATPEELPVVEMPELIEHLPAADVPAIAEEVPAGEVETSVENLSATEVPPIAEEVSPAEIPLEAEQISEAEMPSWIEEVQAPEVTSAPEVPSATEVPVMAEISPAAEGPQEIEQIPAAEAPAWIEEVQAAEETPATEEPPTTEVPIMAEEGPAAEVPQDNEQIPAAETTPAEQLPAAEVPAWIEEGPEAGVTPAPQEPPATEVSMMAEEVPAAEVPQEIEQIPTAETPTAEQLAAGTIPAWIEEGPEAEVTPSPEEHTTSEGPALTEEGPAAEVPAWIEELPEAELPAAAEQVPTSRGPLLAEETPLAEELPPAESIPEVEVPAITEEMPVEEGSALSEEIPTVEIPEKVEPTPAVELPTIPEEILAQEPPLPVEGELAAVEAGSTSEEEEFGWLEGLVAEQITTDEVLPTPPETGEITPPEWVKLEAEPPMEEIIKPESLVPPTTPARADEVPDWIKGLGEEPESEPAPQEPAATAAEIELTPSEELPAWLRELEEPGAKKPEALPAEPGLEWKADELPDWLKELTESEPSAEAPALVETPAPVEEPTPVVAPALEEPPSTVETPAMEEVSPVAIEAATQWTAEITPPAGIKKEALEEIPSKAETLEPIVEAPLPQELAIPVEASLAPAPVSEEVVAPSPETTTAPEEVSLDTFQAVSRANQAALTDARACVSQGQPTQAAVFYTQLIKQNYHLDEIIKDLHDALYRFPVDVELWVSLGDAFIRTDDLQEALSAYTKAEELVR